MLWFIDVKTYGFDESESPAWVQGHEFKASDYRQADKYAAEWIARRYGIHADAIEYRIANRSTRRVNSI